MYLVGPFHQVSFLRNMAAKWLPGITLVGSAPRILRGAHEIPGERDGVQYLQQKSVA